MKTKGGNKYGKTLILGSGSMFGTIEILAKTADVIRKLITNIFRRLMHVDSFYKAIMYESIFDIKLANGPVTRD